MDTFASLGRIEAIRQLFEGSPYKAFEEPLFIESKAYSTSVNKLLLEGTDFNLVYFPLKHLGYKSIVSVTGELYAVLSSPQALSITLGISAKLDFEQIKEFWSGVVVAAKEFGYQKLSLDLVPSRNGLSIAISALGTEEPDTTRPIAKSKDLICVSGSLGAAYLGQQVLEHKSEELEKYKMLIAAYLKPELQAKLPQTLKESTITPSYGYFVTRGLGDSIKRLVRDSGLGAKIYAEKMPFEGNSFELGKNLDIDPISAAMNGGDDYRLLFVIPLEQYERFRTDFQVFDIIGHLARPEVGAVLVTPDGLEHEISAQGW